jgi:hypothetical protein
MTTTVTLSTFLPHGRHMSLLRIHHVEPLANVMRAAQEFHPEIIRAAPQSMLRFTHDIGSGSSTFLTAKIHLSW